jgi:hypothetical protein
MKNSHSMQQTSREEKRDFSVTSVSSTNEIIIGGDFLAANGKSHSLVSRPETRTTRIYYLKQHGDLKKSSLIVVVSSFSFLE